jgi:pimeloyl-ACP methyl ester carboxylesterase
MLRRVMTLISSLILLIGLVGVTPSAANIPAPGLDWRPCGQGQSCAWLQVPIDYDNPASGTIDLRLVRIPAQSATPVGSLVINPSGPGGPGVAFVRSFAASLPPAVRQAYDVIGLDTRGTGDSSPLRCVSPEFMNTFFRLDSTPTTVKEQQRWMKASGRWSPGCLTNQPQLAAHMDTASLVRDLESVRNALGEPVLNFLGFSYGTLLGARYAQEYPQRVGRLVLDGGIDSRLDSMEISREQAAGFQLSLKRFASACATQQQCRLGTSKSTVLRRINELLRRIDAQPMRTQTGRTLVEAEALTAIVTAMYSRESWPALWSALSQALRGDGTELQRIADIGNGRTGPKEFAANFTAPFLATTCLESPRPPQRIGLDKAAKLWSRNTAVPRVSALLAWSNAPCSRWFTRGTPPSAVSSSTENPIMIIGTRYDPATPYKWSLAMHQQLPTSFLVTSEDDGHTAFVGGSTCIDDAVTTYLVSGVTSDDLRCPAS